jgi:hypothetical protein
MALNYTYEVIILFYFRVFANYFEFYITKVLIINVKRKLLNKFKNNLDRKNITNKLSIIIINKIGTHT